MVGHHVFQVIKLDVDVLKARRCQEHLGSIAIAAPTLGKDNNLEKQVEMAAGAVGIILLVTRSRFKSMVSWEYY
jgi:hypothetical protein